MRTPTQGSNPMCNARFDAWGAVVFCTIISVALCSFWLNIECVLVCLWGGVV